MFNRTDSAPTHKSIAPPPSGAFFKGDSMIDKSDYIYFRELFELFNVYQTPKLKRILDDQGVGYFIDAKGKPFTTREAIEKAMKHPAASAASS